MEGGVIEEAGGGELDYPYPEVFGVDAGAVEVHKDGVDGFFDGYGLYGVVGGVAQGGFDVGEGVVGPGDEFDFAVAGGEYGLDGVFTDDVQAIGGGGEADEAVVLCDGADFGEVGKDGHWGLAVDLQAGVFRW